MGRSGKWLLLPRVKRLSPLLPEVTAACLAYSTHILGLAADNVAGDGEASMSGHSYHIEHTGASGPEHTNQRPLQRGYVQVGRLRPWLQDSRPL